MNVPIIVTADSLLSQSPVAYSNYFVFVHLAKLEMVVFQIIKIVPMATIACAKKKSSGATFQTRIVIISQLQPTGLATFWCFVALSTNRAIGRACCGQ